MNVNDFELIAKLLYKNSGLVLGKNKAYLLESRLNPVARKWNLKGFDELAQALRLGKDARLANDVIEAMTTNESFWTHPGKVEAPYTVCIASASNLTGLVKSSVECRRTGL